MLSRSGVVSSPTREAGTWAAVGLPQVRRLWARICSDNPESPFNESRDHLQHCSTFSFKKAVEYYARGLILRGCPKSWNYFVSSTSQQAKANARRFKCNILRIHSLTQCFKRLLNSTSAEFVATASKPDAAAPTTHSSQRELLLCGVHAVNAVLDGLGRPQLTKEQIDEINRNLAASESFILAAGIPPNNIVQPAGNYPIDVLTLALQAFGDCSVERVTHLPVQPSFYLTGNGHHWQMVTSGPKGRWVVNDGDYLFPVANELALQQQ